MPSRRTTRESAKNGGRAREGEQFKKVLARASTSATHSKTPHRVRSFAPQMTDLVQLEDKFREMAQRVRDSTGDGTKSNEAKLIIYALYKQGTVGDVQGDQPWAYQFEARAKWDAWAALKGMDKPAAWRKYIDEAEKQLS